MHHYERTGAYAKAEDALYALLEAAPDDTEIVDWGIKFYERLQGYRRCRPGGRKSATRRVGRKFGGTQGALEHDAGVGADRKLGALACRRRLIRT